MKKDHVSRLEREMINIEKQFSSHKLVTMRNLTYLLKSDIFNELGRTQKAKIMKEVKENCKQALQELAHVMQFLPKKQSSEVQNEYAQTLYSNFIQIGLRGISNSMPRQFSLVVQEMIRPILQLLVAISETEIKGVPKLTDSFKKEVLGKNIVSLYSIYCLE